MTATDLRAAEKAKLDQLSVARDAAAKERDRLDGELDLARVRVMDLIDAGYSPTRLTLTEAWDHFVAAEKRYEQAADAHMAAFRAWEQAR